MPLRLRQLDWDKQSCRKRYDQLDVRHWEWTSRIYVPDKLIIRGDEQRKHWDICVPIQRQHAWDVVFRLGRSKNQNEERSKEDSLWLEDCAGYGRQQAHFLDYLIKEEILRAALHLAHRRLHARFCACAWLLDQTDECRRLKGTRWRLSRLILFLAHAQEQLWLCLWVSTQRWEVGRAHPL